VHQLLSDIHSFWGKIPNSLKNRFLRVLIDRIDICLTNNEQSIITSICLRTVEQYELLTKFNSSWRQPKWSAEEEAILHQVWPLEKTDAIKVNCRIAVGLQ
jgi:hypothetical protein